MPYSHIQFDHITDDFVREVFGRADLYLSDVYGMFTLPPPSLPGAGGGNWAIALVLLCVVDGISRHVYPTEHIVRNQEKRFRRLIRKKLHWGPANRGWY